MEILETIVYFIFVLGVLVFVHELGHFLVAKKAGIRVEQFSLGFPPKALGVTVGETEYCISWLPIGGYVKVAGMSDFGNETVKGEPWEFQSKPKGVQMAVMAAGPAMNFLLGFLLILGVRLGAGEYVMQTTRIGQIADSSPLKAAGLRSADRVVSVGGEPVADWEGLIKAFRSARGSTVPVVAMREGETFSVEVSVGPSEGPGIEPFLSSTAGSVVPGYPAERAGLKPGDRIVSVDGTPVSQWWEMRDEISARPGKEIEIRWVRDGVEMAAQVVPQPEQEGDRTIGLIGIGPSTESMARVPVAFGAAVQRSGRDVARYTTLIFTFVKRLVTGEVSGRALAGPVGIAQMTGQSARQGWEALCAFMAMLSINLAVLNLMPIPALDGGHLLIISVEAVLRRSLSTRQKEMLQQAGFIFLLCLMVYVTFGDINRIFGWFN